MFKPTSATTPEEYLAQLPDERRETIATVREVIRKNLPAGFEESLLWGLIAYSVPLRILPDTYNGQPLCYVALGAQKNHYAVYLMNVYGDTKLNAWFQDAYKKAGKKLDMGKSCVRFKKLDDLPLDVIGETVSKVSMNDYIEIYRKSRLLTKAGKAKTASAKRHASKEASKKK